MRVRIHAPWRRNGAYVGVAAAVTALGLVASATPALAHANIVTAITSCPIVAGGDYQISWTIANDWNLPETAQVTYATSGPDSLSQTTLAIPASGNGSGGTGQLPYRSVSVVQTLPQSVTGTLFLNVSGAYSDTYPTSNSGQIAAPTNCPPVVAPTPTTIAPAIAASVSPTTFPTIAAAISPPTTATATPPPAKTLKIGHSTSGRKRPPTNGLKRPTLLASTLPAAKPHVPVTKAATFTG